MSKQQRLILKLALTYWGSVNHQQSANVNYTLSTLPCGNRIYHGSFQTKSVSSSFR